MVSNCTPLLVHLFLYLWEAEFIKELFNKSEKKLVRFFHFKMELYRWFPWLNNCRFGDFLDRIYLIELEINDTTYTYIAAPYLDLHLEIDSEWRLRTNFTTKRRLQLSHRELSIDMQQHSISACIWSIYLSVDRACSSYQDFLDRGLLLTRKLLTKGFILVELN